ncbi:MAG: zinc ribbon domain-containing protein [Deltaproteobacteria bacterium]|nr:zinc ribbon domain-containing protein [Deltaproteobacteria bacterium]
MPTYEFTCHRCHQEFEVRVARIDGRPEGCTACGSTDFERVLSTFAAHTSSGGGARAELPPCGMGNACGRVTGQGCGGGGMA